VSLLDFASLRVDYVGVADHLTPYGAIIEHARGATSKRQAALAAGISEGRWRQIVTGMQHVGDGQTVRARPKRETLLAMARAVGADAVAVLTAAGMDVGGLDEDPGHVAAPGDLADEHTMEGVVLAEVRAMREDVKALSSRVERLESRAEPVGGSDGQT
jgi:hypothetical protein